MPEQSGASANDQHDAIEVDPRTADIGPTDAEVEAWAHQERERREAWLRGPSQAQKSDWAEREHVRRLAEKGLRRGSSGEASGDSPVYLMQRYVREAQLAAEGVMSLVLSTSVKDVFDQLVQAGREWEDEYTSRPARRRIPLDAESASEGGRTSKSAGESPGTASTTS
jgi:hypothetical protein